MQVGFSSDKNLPDRFGLDPADPQSNLVWRQPYGCRSTPLVMNGKVFIINSDGEGVNEGERVMAFDAATGNVLWEHKFNVFHTDIVSSRVGWANLSGDRGSNRIYAHGTQGFLMCLDGNDGKPVWQHSLTEEYGRVTGYGGRIVSPTVFGDVVVVGLINASWGDQARGQNRFVAFDKANGVVRWWSSPCEVLKGTYYSNPIFRRINGQDLMISGAADGTLLALQANTGNKVWSYQVGANVINTSPVARGDLIYVTHGEENVDVAEMGRVVCVDAGQVENGRPKLVWEEVGVKAGLASPALSPAEGGLDQLYVPDDGAALFCFNPLTGKRLWKYKYGRVSRGAPVVADGKIFIAEVNSRFHILKPGDRKCEQLSEQTFFDKAGGFVEINATPAVANGRIYFGTRDDVFCAGRKEWSSDEKIALTNLRPEPSPQNPSTPATALLWPADVTLSPGDSMTFQPIAYTADGRTIGPMLNAKWSLPLPPKTPAGMQPPALRGEIVDGKLTVAANVPGQQGYIEAEIGELKARARVRVAPQLPYAPDLSKVPVGAMPGGWINVQGKYEVVERDGRRVVKKLANDARPPLARANAYITTPDTANYTIQADVMGTYVNQNLPDHGVINARYTLQLAGNKQELRILSWEALPRIDKTIAFPWKADAWSTLKLTTEYRDGVCVVRGKAWTRGEPEPSNWTIEVEDPRPNREGSAALYAYATGILQTNDGKVVPGAESFFDNIRVTPNK
jgi:outer membrane protein assembly factor BamB